MKNNIRRGLPLLLAAMLLCVGLLAALAEGGTGFGTIQANLGRTDIAQDAVDAAESIEWVNATAGSLDPAAPKDWTFMVYLCGSNLGMSAKADLEEMARSNFDMEKINVVAYTGGAPSWGGANIPVDRNALLEITNNTVKQVGEYPLSDMSLQATLRHFTSVAVDKYPAEKYALVLWDHGGGPNGGIFSDVLYKGTPMPIKDLKVALDNGPFAKNKLDILGFDACLMGSVEIAKAMTPYAKYMIASEETEPGYGWNYAFLKDIGSDTGVKEISEKIIDDYFSYIAEKRNNVPGEITMSCVDLSQIEDIKAACADYFKDADAKLNGDTYVEFAKAREKAASFGEHGYDLVDLGAFAKNLSISDTDKQAKLVSSIEKAVIAKRPDRADVMGLSIYHPYDRGSDYNFFKGTYADLSPTEEYTRYIDSFTAYLNGESYADFSSISQLPSLRDMEKAERDINSTFTLQLTEAQINFMAEVEMQAFISQDDGQSLQLVSIVPDVTIGEDNTVTAAYVHRALFITEGDDAEIRSAALPYDYIGDGLYQLDAVLVGHDEAGQEIRQSVRLEYALSDEDGTLELREIWVSDDSIEGAYTTRHNVYLDDYEQMEITREVRKPVSTDEGLIADYGDWEQADIETESMPLDGNHSLRMLHDVLDRDKIYVAFGVRDYQNRHYTSALIKLTGDVEHTVLRPAYDDDLMKLNVSWPTVNVEGSVAGMIFNIRVTNHSGVDDAIFQVTNVRVNGHETSAFVEIYGNGNNEGLLIDEEEVAMLLIRAEELSGLGTVTDLDFDIVILDTNNGDAPVTEEPLEVHVSMNVDVSAFG